MTTISLIAAPHRYRLGLPERLRDRIAAISVRRQKRRELRELAQLPKHLLRDIGLEHHVPDRSPDVITFWR
ncbi:DUF1127 domain-containing protein [Yoonia sp. F2084L]|uniref:DUF1127 domain-containing protein n=1 Tax=Yoonia sp. F2084L TaxID=2926419 RepID=UPI001FF48768|nr:DUF1127 domain-containing protein [Yoonia sp. F2084L]MCK0097736.1 DUF1127 domain-containing protein [Yoonia sp. F2084L]